MGFEGGDGEALRYIITRLLRLSFPNQKSRRRLSSRSIDYALAPRRCADSIAAIAWTFIAKIRHRSDRNRSVRKKKKERTVRATRCARVVAQRESRGSPSIRDGKRPFFTCNCSFPPSPLRLPPIRAFFLRRRNR